jgi:hypothetical protein
MGVFPLSESSSDPLRIKVAGVNQIIFKPGNHKDGTDLDISADFIESRGGYREI